MKRPADFSIGVFFDADGCTCLARFIVWLNILLQLLFPMACAFTPAIVHAQHIVTVSADAAESSTQVYTLGRGESVRSVAQKYHLTVEELRKLNQFRSFAHGFSGLQAGDELDVPAAKAPRSKPAPTEDHVADEQQQKIAGLASQAGSFLSSSPDGQAAQSLVTGMVTGEASSHLQQVLSRYGTARVQLGVDENFSLKNSEFDLLLPLWERQSTLLFTQGSLHRTDDRTQSNLGLGLRYFTDNWMLGGNTFLDYDLSRDHSRLGFGLEYGRDFLKLSANGYQRLSNWKNSPDVEDYQERPANGWDVRAEGWLPALPQLGGKIVYEQYYGDEVALFDKDDRQRDPHAITFGLNYTPVPLITLNAEQRQGSADDNETRVGLDLNYQLGVPWSHQIDPDGVAAMHTLNGSRYELVERNNSIVLEYRKQEVIRLKTAELVTGSGGERKSLGVTVNSKHGVKRIDWSAASLLAAGGKIIANSTTSYDVLLPPWQSAQGGNNTYLVTGVAVDNNDNRSTPSDTQVTVNAAEISVANSHFLPDSPLKSSPTTSYLPADGKTQGVATLTLVNDQQQPVDVPLSDITLTTAIAGLPASSGGLQASSEKVSASSVKDATVSAFTRKSAGVYKVTVTAGTKPEMLTLTPAVRKTALNAVRFFIIQATPDGGQSTFAASPKTLPADNTAVSTLTLTAKDASGNPLSGVAGNLSVLVSDSHGAAPSVGSVTISSMTETTTAGTYTATLKGTLAGVYTVKPQFSGSAIGTLSDSVTLTAGTTPDGAQSTFSASPKSIAADNSAVSTLTVMLKDANGNVMVNQAGNLSISVKDSGNSTPSSTQVAVSSLSESATPGTYTATLKGTLAGTYTLTPQFSGSAIGTLSDSVTLTAGTAPDGAQSTFSASPKSIAADNSAISTLTVMLKDANGNVMVNQAGNLSISVKDSGNSTPSSTQVAVSSLSESATPGTYTATLKGTLAGVYTVKPQFNGSAVGTLSDSVTLTAGTTPDGAQSTFSASPKSIAADNSAISTLTVMLKDANGNVMVNQAGNLSISVKDSGNSTPSSTQVAVSSLSESATPGTYTATLKGTLAGTYTLTPQFSGSAIGTLSDSVTLTAGTTPDGAQSTFSASPKSIAADNSAISTLMVMLKDANGNVMVNQAGNLSISVKDSGNSTPSSTQVAVSSLSESATPGTYTATLKGTLAGTYTLTPQFSGSAIGTLSDSVTLTANTTPDGVQSTFAASPVSIVADDTTTSTLTLTAKDLYGNAIAGIASGLTLEVKDSLGATPAAGKVTVSAVTESATPGTYTATLKGQLADVYTVKPQFSGSAIGTLSGTVTLTANTTPDGVQSTFAASPVSIVADDTTISTLTLTAKDLYGNAIAGIASGLTLEVKDSLGATPAAGKVTVSAVTESATPGTYTATLKGQLADVYTVKPQFSGSAIGTLSGTVTLTANTTPDGVQSTFAASPVSIVADDTTTSTLTLTAKDQYGNAIAGIASGLTLEVKDSLGATPAAGKVTVSAITESATPGTYTATLKGQLADVYTVKPQFSGSAIGTLSGTVTLTAGNPDGVQSTFAASPVSIVADDTTTSTLTLTAKDLYGNAIAGIASSLTLEVKNSQGVTPEKDAIIPGTGVTVSAVTESATPGTYTATLKGQLADVYTVRPQFSGTVIGTLSGTVTLTMSAFKDISVNGSNFSVGSGFPTTAFMNALFTLNVPVGKVASDYYWYINPEADGFAMVSNGGAVSFTDLGGNGKNSTVTVVAVPNSPGPTLGYTFTVRHWFKATSTFLHSYSEASTYCTNDAGGYPGMSLPTVGMLYSGSAVRSIGTLWGEWGDMAKYGWSQSATYWYMTQDIPSAGYHSTVLLGASPEISSNADSSSGAFPSVCTRPG